MADLNLGANFEATKGQGKGALRGREGVVGREEEELELLGLVDRARKDERRAGEGLDLGEGGVAV